MSVQVIHGANEMFYDLEGLSVTEIREITKDALNLPFNIDAYINGNQIGGDYVLNENENLEFVRARGMKGGLHDFFSEEELSDYYGQELFQKMLDAGLDTVVEPVFTNQSVKEAIQKVSGAMNDESSPVKIDFASRSVTINGQSEVFLEGLSFKLMSAIYRRNGKPVSYEILKREVWEALDQDIKDDSVRTAIHRLRHKMNLNDQSRIKILCQDRFVRLVIR